MPRWECSECGTVINRPQPPARCRKCDSSGTVFVAADDRDDTTATESMFESWVQHGMRTTRHWRAHS